MGARAESGGPDPHALRHAPASNRPRRPGRFALQGERSGEESNPRPGDLHQASRLAADRLGGPLPGAPGPNRTGIGRLQGDCSATELRGRGAGAVTNRYLIEADARRARRGASSASRFRRWARGPAGSSSTFAVRCWSTVIPGVLRRLGSPQIVAALRTQEASRRTSWRRTPNGIRTRVSTLRGWRPRPLVDGGKGGAGRTRTCNLRFWRPVLSQLSYDPLRAAAGAATQVPAGWRRQAMEDQAHFAVHPALRWDVSTPAAWTLRGGRDGSYRYSPRAWRLCPPARSTVASGRRDGAREGLR